jgi:hypothetical protein
MEAKTMKRFAEVLPAAGLALLFTALVSLQLIGVESVGGWTQTIVGTMALIFGLLILSLCITGPVILGVLYLLKKTRNKQ